MTSDSKGGTSQPEIPESFKELLPVYRFHGPNNSVIGWHTHFEFHCVKTHQHTLT